MTLYDFNKLQTLNDKMAAVNENGIYLDNHITEKRKCNLYSIDKFFVEVTYNPITNKIDKITGFKTGHLLDKYSGFRY